MCQHNLCAECCIFSGQIIGRGATRKLFASIDNYLIVYADKSLTYSALRDIPNSHQQAKPPNVRIMVNIPPTSFRPIACYILQI